MSISIGANVSGANLVAASLAGPSERRTDQAMTAQDAAPRPSRKG